MEVHPFKGTPCECIKYKDYTTLKTNPFETNSVASKNERQVQSTRDMVQVNGRSPALVTSLENIPEDDLEYMDKTRKLPELDLFKSFKFPKNNEGEDRKNTEEELIEGNLIG